MKRYKIERPTTVTMPHCSIQLLLSSYHLPSFYSPLTPVFSPVALSCSRALLMCWKTEGTPKKSAFPVRIGLVGSD